METLRRFKENGKSFQVQFTVAFAIPDWALRFFFFGNSISGNKTRWNLEARGYEICARGFFFALTVSDTRGGEQYFLKIFSRCFSHPVRLQFGCNGNPPVFHGVGDWSEPASRICGCVECHSPLLRWTGVRISGYLLVGGPVLQHDHRLVLLLFIRFFPGPFALRQLSYGG